jgi:hypothetical protein
MPVIEGPTSDPSPFLIEYSGITAVASRIAALAKPSGSYRAIRSIANISNLSPLETSFPYMWLERPGAIFFGPQLGNLSTQILLGFLTGNLAHSLVFERRTDYVYSSPTGSYCQELHGLGVIGIEHYNHDLSFTSKAEMAWSGRY